MFTQELKEDKIFIVKDLLKELETKEEYDFLMGYVTCLYDVHILDKKEAQELEMSAKNIMNIEIKKWSDVTDSIYIK